MTGTTNVGGMTVDQALAKGTADATATAADLVKGKTAYSKGKKISGNAPAIKSTTLIFNAGTTYNKDYSSHFDSVGSYAYNSSTVEKDTIQGTTNNAYRYFCKEIAYSGNILGFKVNGVYYPLFRLRSIGMQINVMNFSAKYWIFSFGGDEVAILVDPGNAKVQVGNTDFGFSTAWNPSKKYTIEVFYMDNL